jgi:hypothetical protein
MVLGGTARGIGQGESIVTLKIDSLLATRKARTGNLGIRFAIALLAVLAFSLSVRAQASDIYITPDGSPQGACSSNVQTPAFFNNSANWGNSSSKIGPGTTVHLCGTISANLTSYGDGAAGKQITILFESGASLSQEANNGNFLNLNNKSHFIIDGGDNGVIQNTANGDALASQIYGAVGVNCTGSSDVEIKNLTIQNIYVHTSGSSGNANVPLTNDVRLGGAPNGSSSIAIKIHDNVFHDSGWSIYDEYGNSDSGHEIYNNKIFNHDHGVAVDGGVSGHTLTGLSIHDNHIYSYANWDCGGACHHSAMHFYNGPSGSTSTNIGSQIYNNLMEGPVGSGLTGHIFIEGAGGSDCFCSKTRFYNNIFLTDTNSSLNNGFIGFFSGKNGPNEIYNNTFIGASNVSGLCLSIANVVGLKMKNNVISSCNTMVSFPTASNTWAPGDLDFNVYANMGGSNQFKTPSGFAATFGAWQSFTGAEANSTNMKSAGLNASGVPQADSLVVAAVASNLSLLDILPLDSDTSAGNTKTPVLRSSWQPGAYFSGTATATNPVAAPRSLTANVQ